MALMAVGVVLRPPRARLSDYNFDLAHSAVAKYFVV